MFGYIQQSRKKDIKTQGKELPSFYPCAFAGRNVARCVI
jgi:hypothetical protein